MGFRPTLFTCTTHSASYIKALLYILLLVKYNTVHCVFLTKSSPVSTKPRICTGGLSREYFMRYSPTFEIIFAWAWLGDGEEVCLKWLIWCKAMAMHCEGVFEGSKKGEFGESQWIRSMLKPLLEASKREKPPEKNNGEYSCYCSKGEKRVKRCHDWLWWWKGEEFECIYSTNNNEKGSDNDTLFVF